MDNEQFTSHSNQWQPIAIPKDFYSFETGQPFERCISCNRDLLTGNAPYMVEKAIKKYSGYEARDVIFEYAMCMSCAMDMRNQMSTASLTKLDDYFSREVNMAAHLQALHTSQDISTSFSNCAVKGTSKEELEEYQLFAYCEGRHISPLVPPYMISGAAIEEVANLLSAKTIDELDDFLGKHFSPPPGLEDVLDRPRLIMV